MTHIKEDEFAELLYQHLLGEDIDEFELDRSLNPPKTRTRTFVEDGQRYELNIEGTEGLSFDSSIPDLITILRLSFENLTTRVDPELFATSIAQTFEDLAQRFGDSTVDMKPEFLLHGISGISLGGVIELIEENGRILSETFLRREEFITEHPPKKVFDNVDQSYDRGHSDVNGGIVICLHDSRLLCVSGASNYIGKSGFFIDEKNRRIYCVSVQGQNPKHKQKGFVNYGNLKAGLGYDPRTFVLELLAGEMKRESFEELKVIRPDVHPYSFMRHHGYVGKNEQAIRDAGCTIESRLYLSRQL